LIITVSCLIPIANDRFIFLDKLIIVAGVEEYFVKFRFDKRLKFRFDKRFTQMFLFENCPLYKKNLYNNYLDYWYYKYYPDTKIKIKLINVYSN